MLLSVASGSYAVHFNETAYRELHTLLNAASYTRIFILVDENTHRFCLRAFLSRIEGDYITETITISAGEAYKNITTCLKVWNALAGHGADRKSLLINLGGGVVSDLGGFVASTYMRGIAYINVPTTLLAMVDASVGGKTGVDLGVLKNLIGVINTPEMVVIDSAFLSTLPENQLKSGLAEMFKHGLIADATYWNKLTALPGSRPDIPDALIRESVCIKNTVVLQDPGERNRRKILNYGHTLGHAIESCFLNTPKPMLHGEAIAIGMIMATYISNIMTGFPEKELKRIKEVMLGHFKKIRFSAADQNKIIALLQHDKKNTGGKSNFVLLSDIGKPVLDQTVPETLLAQAFAYYKK
ncbi:MAG: 3-dehydroquinate synthase [Sinomicrobium sp.]|nr:3-dehydroquinate synthase [Sinomicrobium sp.]